MIHVADWSVDHPCPAVCANVSPLNKIRIAIGFTLGASQIKAFSHIGHVLRRICQVISMEWLLGSCELGKEVIHVGIEALGLKVELITVIIVIS